MIDPFLFAPWVSSEAAALFSESSTEPSAPGDDIAALRAHYDAFNLRHLEVALDCHPVDTREDEIAGVRVHVVTPRDHTALKGTLLCLHGGAFMWGQGAGALLEAVPVAATAGMRVIAVEYALAPEQVFPAAVVDVLAVYDAVRGLRPDAGIGIYGCSAGGILTSQVVARMIADGIPLPNAIAMLCGTGLEFDGDSAMTAAAFSGRPKSGGGLQLRSLPYFTNADFGDPLVMPGGHADLLARFPPSLLVTGTRDFASSAMTVMHRRLLAAGVDASLMQFDGMWHAYHMATTLPEARETFAALSRFFNKHLA